MARKLAHAQRRETDESGWKITRWESFADYMNEKIEGSHCSMRKVAADLKIGPSHLSMIRQGKIVPYPTTCKRVAQHFGDNSTLVLIAAGWISVDDFDPEEKLKLFVKSLEGEPDILQTLLAKFKRLNRVNRVEIEKIMDLKLDIQKSGIIEK